MTSFQYDNFFHYRSKLAWLIVLLAWLLLSSSVVLAETPPEETPEALLRQAVADRFATQEDPLEMGATKIIGDWAFMSLRDPETHEGQQTALAHWQDDQWQLALSDSDQFLAWLDQLPATLLSAEATEYWQPGNTTAGSYAPPLLLPFPANQTWRYLAGPNGGPYHRAVDFGPLSYRDPVNPYGPLSGRERDVTAAAPGVVIDRDKNLLILRHAYGWETGYYGLADNSIRHSLGDVVNIGERIGLASDDVEPSLGVRVSFWVRRYGVDQPIDGLELSGWVIRQDNSFASGERAGEIVYGYHINKIDCGTVADNFFDYTECHITHYAQPILQVAPEITRLPQNSTGKSVVEILGVYDLQHIEFTLTNSPDDFRSPFFTVTNVTLGSVFDETTPSPTKPYTSPQRDPLSPLLTFEADLTPTFSGSGSVVEIEWRGLIRGETLLTLSDVKLTNSKGEKIPLTLRDGRLQVLGNYLVEGRVHLHGGVAYHDVIITLDNREVRPNDEGVFSMEADGPYILQISAPKHLSARFESEGEGVDLGEIELLPGDVNGDDQVDVFDLAYIGNRYQTSNPQADVNGDGQVNVFDLSLAATHYGKQGPMELQP